MMNNVDDADLQNAVNAINICRGFIDEIKSDNSDMIIENINLVNNDGIDVFLASDLICSSCNLGITRYTLNCKTDKSFEILRLMGINIEKNQDRVVSEFNKLKFAYIYLNSDSYIEKKNNNPDLSTYSEICDKLLNPLGVKNCTIGVSSRDDVEKFAKICLKLNNTNSLIMSGFNGLPFVTLEGDSFIAEAWKNKIFTYIFSPNLLGFNADGNSKDVICDDNSQNAQILSDVFAAKLKDSPAYNTVVLNSALVLYISKVSPSVVDGISLAKKTIDSGVVKEKIEQLKKFFS